MATMMCAHESAAGGHMAGIRVVVCDPEREVRARVRSAIERDSMLVLVGESGLWRECEAHLDTLLPDLLIVRSNLLPMSWTQRVEDDLFSPVVITLREPRPQLLPMRPGNDLPLPVEPELISRFLNKAVMEIYDRKVKQLLDLVERYVDGSVALHAYPSFLSVERDGQTTNLSIPSILSIIAARKYVSIESSEGTFLLREPIHQLAARLDPSVFVRIHRSIIVNRRHINIVASRELKSHVVLQDGSRYPIGPNYRDVLSDILESAR